MDANYALFATTDPLFYDAPHRRPMSAAGSFQPEDAASWTDWSHTEDDTWSFWTPPAVNLPEQGWKVHISATPNTAHVVLSAVSRYCRTRSLPFKFLRHQAVLMATLSKDADRRLSGKFITIYPPRADLQLHLQALDSALAGLPGPYVLSDLRWKSGPVFVRYGAFARQFVNDNGTDVPAIRNLDTGALIPDRRDPVFHVPAWVTTPPFLQKQLAQLDPNPPAGFPRVLGALHFSNAGGVFEAEVEGSPVILKEARPHVGWTPDGRNAVQRLHDEARTLRTLHGRVPVPAVFGIFTAHEHAYLAIEQIEATPLRAAVAARNPLATAEHSLPARRQYRHWAVTVIKSLRRAVASLHAAGYVHGDLHPGNVLVREDDTVVLIDLEMSRPVDVDEAAGIGAPGFVAMSERNGVERDLYALSCVEVFMFIPLLPLVPLDPSKAATLVREASDRFDLTPSWEFEQLRRLRPTGRTQAPEPTSIPARAVASSVRLIAETLLRDATPDRSDRLWPGDPAQFGCPPAGLAHGALGVIAALDHAGYSPRPGHLEWVDATDLLSAGRPGLFDGHAGAVWAYRRMGLDEAADQHLGALVRTASIAAGFDLYGGLSGIGLIYLAELERRPDLMAGTLEIAARIRARWRDAVPPQQVATGASGLLRGATGSALFAVRLFELSGDPDHLRAATDAIDYDLHSLRAAADGGLHVDEGWRLLPYLGCGSAGIGIVLAQILRHLPGHPRYLEVLDGIARAATAPFTAQSGLFEGRAGLIQFLLTMQRTGLDTDARGSALRHHVSALEMHALHHKDQLRFAGDGLLRASCDLATGAAGVLATLVDYDAWVRGARSEATFMPFSTPLRSVEIHSPLGAAGLQRGGEMNGLSPVTAGA